MLTSTEVFNVIVHEVQQIHRRPAGLHEPLVQAPSEGGQAHERSETSLGLGLGLFIVREIVLGHGGTIAVESSTQRGTVFTIRLPRQCR